MSQLKTAGKYLELVRRYGFARASATDGWTRNRLIAIEQSYLVLAHGARVLERAEKTAPVEQIRSDPD